MTICVDDLREYPNRPFGHRYWCHLYDSEGNVESLHAFAAQLGMKRSWFQPARPGQRPQHNHYDLTPTKRMLAVELGATEVDLRTMANHMIGNVTNEI